MAIRLTDDNNNNRIDPNAQDDNNQNNNSDKLPPKPANNNGGMMGDLSDKYSNLSGNQKSAVAVAAGTVLVVGIWKYPRIMATALLAIYAFIVYKVANPDALAKLFSFEDTMTNIGLGVGAIALLFGILKYPRITFLVGLAIGAALIYFYGDTSSLSI